MARLAGTDDERPWDRVEEPTVDEHGAEVHPSWGLLGASRVQSTGTELFDSDLRHQHYVVVKLSQAYRTRDLNNDRIYARDRVIEVAMSEAQWASFVSSMNTGDGVPCTITGSKLQEGWYVPKAPFLPRLRESMKEVAGAASKSLEAVVKAYDEVVVAFDSGGKKAQREALRNLGIVLGNAPKNMEFAASQLTKHTENVVQRARADLEAMVSNKARQLGLEPGDVGGYTLELEEGHIEGEATEA